MDLRFTRVELLNWRNFRSADVELRPRAFLVGPNASGKSNFLDAFRFLRDVAGVGGGLQSAVDQRGGVSRVRCLAARKNPDVGIVVALGNDAEPNEWTYELRFTQESAGRRRPVLKLERVTRRGEIILTRPDTHDEADPERRTQTALEQVTANRDFRAVSEFLQQVRYLHLVPQLVREPDRSVNHPNDPYGGDFLEQVAKTARRTRDARLRKIRDALQVAVPQLSELALEQDFNGAWHLRGKYEHWRPQGAWQDEADLSDGTLRLIGLLWVLLQHGGPLLLEEPELSLHPEVVRWLPQLFARIQRSTESQVILSTHSSDLLRDEGIGVDEVLMLIPGAEGTQVSLASSFTDIELLLRGGLSLADVVLPRTRPARVDQLALFKP